jgi:hypothetical protein
LRKTGLTRENADNMANNTDVAIVILAAGRRPLVEHVGAQLRDIKTALTYCSIGRKTTARTC